MIPLFAGLAITLHFETLAFNLGLEAFEFRVVFDCRRRSHGTRCGLDEERLRLVPIPIQFRPSEVIALAILRVNLAVAAGGRQNLESSQYPGSSISSPPMFRKCLSFFVESFSPSNTAVAAIKASQGSKPLALQYVFMRL